MEKNYTIEILEEEADAIRSSYAKSGGIEWVRLVITLKALIEEYTSEKMFDKVAICNKEIDSVLKLVHDNRAVPLSVPQFSESVNTYYDEISEWAAKSEQCKNELGLNVSYAQYANSINGLCNYLCLAKQYDIALLKYEEALQILLSISIPNGDEEYIFNTIVILLKASICALEVGNNTLSRHYGIYSLQFLTENMTKCNSFSKVRWSYVAELCEKMICNND